MKNNYPPVLILCGGLGTRVRNIYPDLPKYLIPIHGEPFAYHQLRLLKKMGFCEIVLCVGYKKEMIKNSLGDGSSFGLQIQYSEENSDKLLGTGGAIKKAVKLVSSPFAVLYGDSYLNFDFDPVFQKFLSSKKLGLMTIFHNKNQLGKSNVVFKNHEIISFDKEKSSSDMEYIDYGFSLFHSDAFNEIDKTAFDLSDIVKKLISEKNLVGYEIDHQFYEAGTIEGKNELEKNLRG
jgi:NDP-sugar pyrophosphorylase family protein